MKKNATINNILGGIGICDYYLGASQFQAALAIDPDLPATDSGDKPCGLLRPTATAKFSVSEITGVPLWMISNPKDGNIYVYANDGKCHVVSSSLAMGTALNSGNALTTSSGNGAAYYDNYLYLARRADIARYGPLNGTASLTQNYWTTTLSLTALNNTTYPSINGVAMPNHVMHRHTDNKLYVADVLTTNQGALHSVCTTKNTVEGDTNDGSDHNALDFPYGVYPTCIETYGVDLVVGLIEGVNTTAKQKPARISFWDTTSDSFSSITSVELSDPLITAIKNVNGILYVFSGYATGGCRISQIVSGYRLQEIAWLPEVYPPLAGAVDHLLNRIIFGSNCVEPEVAGTVYALGAKEANFPMGLHSILRATGAGNNPWVTAVKYPSQTSGTKPPIIVGWDDDTAKGLDKYSTTYGNQNIWASDLFIVGRKFQVSKVIVPLAQAVAANMTLKISIIGDDGTTTPSADKQTLITVNNTNYPSSEKAIVFYPEESFNNNCYLLLEWSGSALLTVGLPITLELDIIDI